MTIKDIALAAGVGVTTVSRALNNQPGVSEATRLRVEQAAEKLNYQPNMFAKSLRAADLSTVAVLVKGPSNPFFNKLYDPLEYLLRRNDFTVTLYRVAHDDDEYARALEICRRYRPAAILFLGGGSPRSHAENLPVPSVVATAPAWSGKSTVSVRIDDRQAICELVDHLVSIGHRSIGFLSTDDNPATVGGLRRAAFLERMADHGLAPAPNHIVTAPLKHRPYSFDYGYQLGCLFAATAPECSAVVGSSDVIALGAMRALYDQGISCPGDVSVTGFDGIDIGRFTIPSLTTMEQPVDAIAQVCVTALTTQLGGGVCAPETVIRGSLRLGDSTGPVAR